MGAVEPPGDVQAMLMHAFASRRTCLKYALSLSLATGSAQQCFASELALAP
jgi:hypothetical protein